MTIPVVAKAKKLGKLAKENGWTGSFSSKIVEGHRITEIKGSRNDERFIVTWDDDATTRIMYRLFKKTSKFNSVSQLANKIESWPDMTAIVANFPPGFWNEQPDLFNETIKRYRRIPINLDEATDDELIDSFLGRELFWWSNLAGKIHSDRVSIPRTKPAQRNTYIKRFDSGRAMFNFIGNYGFRSVMIDSIVQVK